MMHACTLQQESALPTFLAEGHLDQLGFGYIADLLGSKAGLHQMLETTGSLLLQEHAGKTWRASYCRADEELEEQSTCLHKTQGCV